MRTGTRQFAEFTRLRFALFDRTPMARTVTTVAELYGVTEATVLAWIQSGELSAMHVGRKAIAKKPRWRITDQALAAFEVARSSNTPPKTRKTRRPKTPPDVIEFYK